MSVKDMIKKSVLESGVFDQYNISSILVALAAALALGILIFLVYRRFYTGVIYSRTFAVTLVGMTVLTCMVTLAISTNVVISLGMVGALSIVRFRTAVKDPMDLLYLFWAITTGITAGAGMYVLALLAAAIMIFMIILFYSRQQRGKIYIAVIHYSGDEAGDEVIRCFGKRKYFIKSKTMRKEKTEMAVEIFCKQTDMDFMEKIRAIEHVDDVTLISIMGNIMAKKRVIRCLIIILTIVLAAGVEMFWLSRRKTIKQYKESQAAFGNPLMGYVPSAWYNEVSEDISLLYMDITWAELEPEEGVYNWASIDEENQISRWRKEGKHLVLRFVCDIPSDEEHMDIPEWLYEKSGEAGRWYDGEDGKGFAPDYNNPTIISCHRKAVRAIGEHFGQDGLISYVELGSLGHWGEWHVNYSEGIQRIPREAVRDKYILPWTEAFPDAMILMRRPFASAEKYGFGLYNDMTGQRRPHRAGWAGSIMVVNMIRQVKRM